MIRARELCARMSLAAFTFLINSGCGRAAEEEVSPFSYHMDAAPETRYSKEAAVEARKRKAAILASFKDVKDDHWAGEYYRGDGLGDNDYFLISPAGFVFETYGCLGLYDRNYGDVTLSNGVMVLHSEYPFEEVGFTVLGAEYVPIAWGERTYLVEMDGIVTFCNAVNAGKEPRKGMRGVIFLKDGDHKQQEIGQPRLPAGFERYLLHETVDATVLRLQDKHVTTNRHGVTVTDFPAVIDKGHKDGIYAGMELYRRDIWELIRATVVDSADESAVVRYRSYGTNIVCPDVGWSMSTSWPNWEGVTSRINTSTVQ